MEVVLRVLESACISESYEQYYGLDPPASAKRERKLKKRYKDLKAFMLVCRDWYGTVSSFLRSGAFEGVRLKCHVPSGYAAILVSRNVL